MYMNGMNQMNIMGLDKVANLLIDSTCKDRI